MDKNIKIFRIIFYVFYTALCILNYRDVAAADICEFYMRGWFYKEVAYIYSPMYICFLVNKIKHYQKSYVVVRLNKKSIILNSEMYENIMLAVEMSVVTNIIRLLCQFMFYKGSIAITECAYYYISSILAQALVWCLLGGICIAIYIMNNKAVFSYILSVIIIIILFEAHSAFFSFSKYMIDVNAHMIINTNEMKSQDIIAMIIHNLIFNLILYFISYILIMHKKIYGDDLKNENI